MRFTKIQGTGNDFIVIDNRDGSIPRSMLAATAARLCTRRVSVGADGMLVVEKPEQGCDFKMEYFNSDGSLGEMCGNGARCMARYAFENGISGGFQRFETTAGIVEGERIDEKNYRIRLNDVTVMRRSVRVSVCDGEFECGYVELGDPGIPHAVVAVPGLKNADPVSLLETGRALRFAKEFPRGANVNFYDITGEDEVTGLTYERGVEDFTLACGTGTASMVAFLTECGEVRGRNVRVSVPGGVLIIDIERTSDGIVRPYLTGLTNIVAEGRVRDEELQLTIDERCVNLHRNEK